MKLPNETYEPYKPPKSDKELEKGKFANNTHEILKKPKTVKGNTVKN